MKKIKILALILVPIFSYSQFPYKLNGTSLASFNGNKVYLTLKENDNRTKIYIDSTVILKGKFSFAGNLTQVANYATFTIKNKTFPYAMPFILDTRVTDYLIVFNDNSLPKYTVEVFASNPNKIEKRLKAVYRKASDQNRKANPNSPTLPSKVYKSVLESQISLLKNYPDDYFSLIALYELSLYNNEKNYLDTIMSVFNGLDEAVKNTPFGVKFSSEKEQIYKSITDTKIGSSVPFFSVAKHNGDIFNNKDLNGKPYVLAFSATWCLPCQEFQPTLQQLYAKYKSKNLEVVYFNLDDNVDVWSSHIQNKKLDWINVSERVKWENSNITKQFHIKAIPQYFVIDKNGKIIYNGKQLGDIDHKLLEQYIVKATN